MWLACFVLAPPRLPSLQPTRWSLNRPVRRPGAMSAALNLLAAQATSSSAGNATASNAGSVTLLTSDWEEIKGIWSDWDETLARLEQHGNQRAHLHWVAQCCASTVRLS